MKTSRFFTMALCAMVVAMGATSCKKDNIGNAGDRMTIGANIGQHGGDGAKTVIGDETDDQFPILWSEGDEFTLYSGENLSGTTFGITSGAGSESAVFEGANPGDAPYFASYTAEEVTRANATTFIYEIPRIQSDLNHAGPMVGYSADGQSVNFENAASWVRIGLKGNAQVTKVELISSVSKSHPSSALSGQLRITVGNDGKIVGTTVMDNKADHSMLEKAYTTPVELNLDEFTYFDFLVPEGAFSGPTKASTNATFKVYGTGNTLLATITKNIPEVQRNKVYVGKYGTPIEPVATPKFSVGDGTTVEFAPGNLYWDGSAFKFEANQWDFRTYEGKNSCIGGSVTTNGTPYGHWGLFGWSTSSTTYGMSTSKNSSDYSGDFKDWGTAPGLPSAGEGKTWRTLTKGEWSYLLGIGTPCRYNASSLCKCKKLDGGTREGLVILPDGTDASVMDSITSTEALATHGAVFLPAAGYREGTGVDYVGSQGFYWSSTPGGSTIANNMYFTLSKTGTSDDSRHYGDPVRLVR